MSPAAGVQFVPPPAHLIPDLQHSMNDALSMLQDEEDIAIVAVGTRTGDQVYVNLAVQARIGKQWETMFWIGKTYGESVETGAVVRWAYKKR